MKKFLPFLVVVFHFVGAMDNGYYDPGYYQAPQQQLFYDAQGNIYDVYGRPVYYNVPPSPAYYHMPSQETVYPTYQLQSPIEQEYPIVSEVKNDNNNTDAQENYVGRIKTAILALPSMLQKNTEQSSTVLSNLKEMIEKIENPQEQKEIFNFFEKTGARLHLDTLKEKNNNDLFNDQCQQLLQSLNGEEKKERTIAIVHHVAETNNTQDTKDVVPVKKKQSKLLPTYEILPQRILAPQEVTIEPKSSSQSVEEPVAIYDVPHDENNATNDDEEEVRKAEQELYERYPELRTDARNSHKPSKLKKLKNQKKKELQDQKRKKHSDKSVVKQSMSQQPEKIILSMTESLKEVTITEETKSVTLYDQLQHAKQLCSQHKKREEGLAELARIVQSGNDRDIQAQAARYLAEIYDPLKPSKNDIAKDATKAVEFYAMVKQYGSITDDNACHALLSSIALQNTEEIKTWLHYVETHATKDGVLLWSQGIGYLMDKDYQKAAGYFGTWSKKKNTVKPEMYALCFSAVTTWVAQNYAQLYKNSDDTTQEVEDHVALRYLLGKMFLEGPDTWKKQEWHVPSREKVLSPLTLIKDAAQEGHPAAIHYLCMTKELADENKIAYIKQVFKQEENDIFTAAEHRDIESAALDMAQKGNMDVAGILVHDAHKRGKLMQWLNKHRSIAEKFSHADQLEKAIPYMSTECQEALKNASHPALRTLAKEIAHQENYPEVVRTMVSKQEETTPVMTQIPLDTIEKEATKTYITQVVENLGNDIAAKVRQELIAIERNFKESGEENRLQDLRVSNIAINNGEVVLTFNEGEKVKSFIRKVPLSKQEKPIDIHNRLKRQNIIANNIFKVLKSDYDKGYYKGVADNLYDAVMQEDLLKHFEKSSDANNKKIRFNTFLSFLKKEGIEQEKIAAIEMLDSQYRNSLNHTEITAVKKKITMVESFFKRYTDIKQTKDEAAFTQLMEEMLHEVPDLNVPSEMHMKVTNDALGKYIFASLAKRSFDMQNQMSQLVGLPIIPITLETSDIIFDTEKVPAQVTPSNTKDEKGDEKVMKAYRAFQALQLLKQAEKSIQTIEEKLNDA